MALLHSPTASGTTLLCFFDDSEQPILSLIPLLIAPQGVVTQALLCVGIYRNPTDAPVFSVLYK